MEIDGWISMPQIDYQAEPQGLDGRAPISIPGLQFSLAQRLAREIRQG